MFVLGKTVITGADNPGLASRKYARIIQKFGLDTNFLEFRIQNVVEGCGIRFSVHLGGGCVSCPVPRADAGITPAIPHKNPLDPAPTQRNAYCNNILLNNIG